jgi:hypothetical protein
VIRSAADGVAAVQNAPARNAEFRGSFGDVTFSQDLERILLHVFFMFDLLPLFRCFPEVWRGRFGIFLCHFFILWRWLFTLLGGG